MLQRTCWTHAAEHDALMTAPSRRLQQTPQAPRRRSCSGTDKAPAAKCRPWLSASLCSLLAPQPPPLHHCAAREKTHTSRLRFAGGSCGGGVERAVPARRFGCGRLRRLLCGGVQHNGVLCKARAPGKKPPALRVRIRGRYVLRPSGKHRHPFSPCPPLGVGSKTGLVLRRPFAFCCKVAARCVGLFVVWSLRVFGLFMRGQLRSPPHPRPCAVVAAPPPR